VAECFLGRLLTKHEVVHHVNRCKDDNRWGNLQVVTRSEHGLLHRDESIERSLAPIDEVMVSTALDGRKTIEAASLLGVHHQTLRNRFDHLLDKRVSPGGDYSETLVSRLRELASDPKVSTRQAQKLTGVTTVTIRKICVKYGIEWVSAPRGREKGCKYTGGHIRTAEQRYFADKVEPLALNPDIGMREAAKILNCGSALIVECCRHFGISWVSARSGRPKSRQN
jgi:hypothetical protein